MVSGSYKGAGININDWLVVGVLAVGGYFRYKTIIKPGADATAGIGEGVGTFGRETGETYESISNVWQSIFDKVTGFINGQNKDNTQTAPPEYKNAGTVSVDNPVQKIETTGKAYGFDTVTIKTPKGSSTILAAPNKYYPTLGVGFNAAGQGYSSAFAGNKAPSKVNATNVFTNKTYGL